MVSNFAVDGERHVTDGRWAMCVAPSRCKATAAAACSKIEEDADDDGPLCCFHHKVMTETACVPS